MAPGFTWTEFVGSTAACMASITLLSAAFSAWLLAPLAMWERLVLAVAALPMILSTPASIVAGLIIGAPVLFRQVIARKAAPAPA